MLSLRSQAIYEDQHLVHLPMTGAAERHKRALNSAVQLSVQMPAPTRADASLLLGATDHGLHGLSATRNARMCRQPTS